MNISDLTDPHKKFIAAVIEAAKECGMTKFTLSYEPHIDTESPATNGKINIIYKGVDDRYRPIFFLSGEAFFQFNLSLDDLTQPQ